MAIRAKPESASISGESPAPTPGTNGDLSAFYAEVFLPLARRVTWRHGLSKEDALDVVQDAFLVAIEKIDLAKNPKAWLIQVVDHLALNHQRKLFRRARLLTRWEAASDETESRRRRDDIAAESS